MKVKKVFKLLFGTVKWSFIVLLLFVGSLFFRTQTIPQFVVTRVTDRYLALPTNVVFHIDSVSFGFMDGLRLRDLRLYDTTSETPLAPVISAKSVVVNPLQRRVELDELVYLRLPASYYAPENIEKNAPVAFDLPDIPAFSLVLKRPNILDVKPETVVADVESSEGRLTASRIRLTWPDQDEPMFLDGFCTVDLVEQRVHGEVRGTAKQHHIRPMLVALDVPSSYPYIDGFTEVPGRVPAFCGWDVNLVNNDFDLDLDLDPNMGRYNGVPMRHANGKLHLHAYTRGTFLNYHHTFGPIVASGVKGEPLEGTVVVDGLNGTNTVTVSAKSALPVADLLRVGGFTGEYVGEEVVGKSSCSLEFKFPRWMGSDYSQLNGKGHLEIHDGRVMRMKGFKGLIEALADKVPGVSWLTDSTQASCDYVIENGVVKTENVYIEGTVFSIKMFGQFDSVKNTLDFTVRVQFVKQDNIVGKILHPLTYPFTKLLLEFRLTGTPEKPEWKYINVIDRVVESMK